MEEECLLGFPAMIIEPDLMFHQEHSEVEQQIILHHFSVLILGARLVNIRPDLVVEEAL